MGSTPIISLAEEDLQVLESNGLNCYETVPVEGENEAIVTTFLEAEALVSSESQTQVDIDGKTWVRVELETGRQCWVNANPTAIEIEETPPSTPSQMASLPSSNDRGNYLPNSPTHPRWEVTNRGLSGLNCYQTHPPNQGSHRVTSRFFNGQILTAAELETNVRAIFEYNDRTWMAVSDPWSGQPCWVRAHEDFIKPIE